MLGKHRFDEDFANTVTHAFGLLLSLVGFVALVLMARAYGDVWHVVSCSIYGTTLVVLYLASTLYHSVRGPRWRRALRRLDHACIYLLIAGTYTPFALVNLREDAGWWLFGLAWGFAVLGVCFKVFYTGRFEMLSVLSYLFLGWSVLFVIRSALENIPAGGIAWLLAGGVAYTVGVLFYACQRAPYAHATWHVFVLIGSACHYLAVMFYVLPPA